MFLKTIMPQLTAITARTHSERERLYSTQATTKVKGTRHTARDTMNIREMRDKQNICENVCGSRLRGRECAMHSVNHITNKNDDEKQQQQQGGNDNTSHINKYIKKEHRWNLI